MTGPIAWFDLTNIMIKSDYIMKLVQSNHDIGPVKSWYWSSRIMTLVQSNHDIHYLSSQIMLFVQSNHAIGPVKSCNWSSQFMTLVQSNHAIGPVKSWHCGPIKSWHCLRKMTKKTHFMPYNSQSILSWKRKTYVTFQKKKSRYKLFIFSVR